MGDLIAVALGLAWSILRPRVRQNPPVRVPVTAPPDPLTMDDVPAPPAPTWGVQRGAC